MTTNSVTSGVVSSGVTLNDGDELDVLYAGYADSTVVNFEGVEVLYAGGTASGTTINFVGTEVVSSGGVADNSIVGFAGAQVISSGGLAQAAVVNSGGDAYVEDGGKAAYATVQPGGQQTVSAGGLAFSTIVNGTEFIEAGGTAELATIIGGTELVQGGSESYEIIGAGGSEVVSSGGVSTNAVAESGGTLTVSAHGQAVGATLMGGGQLIVLDFGNASSTVLSAGGSETVSAGGLDDGATVYAGGTQEVAAGGLAGNADIAVGGQVMVDSGGNADFEAVSGGTMTVQAGGEVLSATVHAGGLLLVEGVSSRTRIEGGGTEEIDVGGTADATSLFDTTATQLIAGGTASGTTATLGRIEVQAGGTAIDATLGAFAVLVVDAGGVASGTKLMGLALLRSDQIVSAGGVSVETLNYSSDEQVYGTASNGFVSGLFSDDGSALEDSTGVQQVFGGGIAVAENVGSAGEQIVEAGGIASATVLCSLLGGAAQVVSAGGYALATVVSSGGTQTVAGNASGSVVDGGAVGVAAGGETFSAEIGDSGSETVSAGGSASGTILNSGGTLSVYGTTTGTTVNSGGEEDVLSGGVASGSVVDWIQLVSSGGLASGAVVGDGGAQTVDGGSATATEVDAGGFQLVFSGGVSVDATIANGGTAIVLSGGTETSASIGAGGAEFVFSGGVAGATTVAGGGALTVSSGGVAGLVEVAAGGSATIEAGGVGAFNQVDDGGFETVSGRAISDTVSGTQSVTGADATTIRTYVEGGDETVQDGGMASGTVVEGLGGAIDEYAGGAGTGSVVSAGGNDVVHAGGVASGAELLGGRQVVSSGGVAVGTVIGSGGHQFVESGGTATNTQVQSGGVEVVSSGGIADGTSIADGGTEVVSSGGVVIGNTDVAVGGTLSVADGAVFDGTDAEVTLDAGAQLLVGAGDVLDLANIPLANYGDILLAGNSYGGGVATLRVAGDVSLSGGGTVSLYDVGGYSNAGVIVGADAGALLDNVDNTISGWGQLGAGMLAFTNEAGGTVTAAYQTLLLHTGRTVFNKGLMDATTGTLLIEDGVDNAGTIAAAGGLVVLGGNGNAATIRGGALDSTGDGSVEVTAAAALDGTSSPVSVAARILVDSAAALTLSGTIANAGTIELNGNVYGGGFATLRVQGAATLTGGGVVRMRDYGGYSYAGNITGSSPADSLVNAGDTISGWGLLGAGALSFTNEAASVVDADTASQTLFVNTGANTVVNKGLLEATGGALDIAGAVSNAGLLLAGTGGMVTLHGAVASAEGVVLAQAGGTLVLDGGGVGGSGGVAVAQGGTLAVASTGSLDGSSQDVSLFGLATVAAAATLTLAGTIKNIGSLALVGNSYGGGVATLRVTGDVSLSGGGTVSLYDVGGYSNAGVIVGADAGALLDNVDNTISGWGQLGAGMLAFTNEAGGTVTAASQILFLHTGRTVFNHGLMDATTGTLLIEDDVDNAGTISAAGGLVQLGGYGLSATIRGGALDGTGDGSVEVTSAAALDGTSSPVSVAARVLVDSTATLTLSGVIANTGTIELNGNAYGGGFATLRIQGAATLTGGGVVQMRDYGSYSYAGMIAGSSAADSLVNAGDTISGWGLLGAGALSFTNGAGGVVDADTASQALFVDTGAGALVNRGILEAQGGVLAVAGGLLNDGTVVQGASGVVSLAGPVGGTGTIALDGAPLTLVAAIGTGQTVAFAAGGAATLTLADPGGFGGTLSGFGPSDALDVQGAMATVSYTVGKSGGPGSLVLSAGGATVATLAVAGSYAGETFLAAPSADGTLVQVVRATVSVDAGTLKVAPLAGRTVSLDEILAAPAYAPGGAVSTLVVDGPGTVVATADATIADVQVKSGTLKLNGQTISTDPVEVTVGAALAGNGRVTGAVTDDGAIVAQGGMLELTGDVGGGGALQVDVGATLALDGATGAGLGIDFLPGGGEALSLGEPLATGATISGFLPGDLIRFAGSYGSVGHSFSGGVLTVTGDGATVASLTFASGFDGAGLSVSEVGGLVTVAEAMACYAAGTRIKTPRGEVAVEHLAVGDTVTTWSGAARALRWIGWRRVDLARHPEPEQVLPIRIKAGALADGVPARDLLVSPDHGMLVDGVLLPARLLLNGRSVVTSPQPSVTYFHLELESHDILLAEGAAAESFLDTGNRAVFENAAVTDLQASFCGDRAAASGACMDLATLPEVSRPVWARVAARAGVEALPEPCWTLAEADLSLELGGRSLRPVWVDASSAMFALPALGCVGSARLRSRAGRPSDARPWLDDRRALGVQVRRLFVDDEALAVDGPALSAGWWPVEPAGGGAPTRWTDGAGAIRIPAWAGVMRIEVAAVGPFGDEVLALGLPKGRCAGV